MSEDKLTLEERQLLLRLARQVLENRIMEKTIHNIDIDTVPENLRKLGATFVTLTKDGQLRGCIGTLEPYQPLVVDVCEHAVSSALHDYRFPPVRVEELESIRIEISRLTTPEPLDYNDADELLSKIKPGVDGVVLRDGFHRATFLPQVWEKIPNPEIFLSHLCIKMGVPADAWRLKKIEVLTYQVEEFHE